jgi:putative ABC transport system substrate-binding protein
MGGSRVSQRKSIVCPSPKRDIVRFIAWTLTLRGTGHMATHIDRRKFITALGGAATLWPLAARAQEAGKVYRLGILTITSGLTRTWDDLFQGLRDLGYVEGQNLTVERRYSEGRAEQWAEMAAELVTLRVDAIVVSTTPAALAAKKATTWKDVPASSTSWVRPKPPRPVSSSNS